jgi:predicted acetyltransferase
MPCKEKRQKFPRGDDAVDKKGLYLEKPIRTDSKAMDSMMSEWRKYGGRMNPGLIRSYNGNFDEWMKYIAGSETDTESDESVPQTLYFMKDSGNEILGAVSLRHYLNQSNIVDGGHIGYGIRPSERGKGYGNEILRLALDKLFEMKIYKVLVTCETDNAASEKVILKNGGRMENTAVDDEGHTIKRYWIENRKNQ